MEKVDRVFRRGVEIGWIIDERADVSEILRDAQVKGMILFLKPKSQSTEDGELFMYEVTPRERIRLDKAQFDARIG